MLLALLGLLEMLALEMLVAFGEKIICGKVVIL